jgi:hypothetical protein
MADAHDQVKHLLYTLGGVKTRLNDVQRAKLLELERSLRKGCLLGNRDRLAARVRPRHGTVPAHGCHLLTAGGFFSRCVSAWKHARKDRRPRKEADQKKNADFGDVLH